MPTVTGQVAVSLTMAVVRQEGFPSLAMDGLVHYAAGWCETVVISQVSGDRVKLL